MKPKYLYIIAIVWLIPFSLNLAQELQNEVSLDVLKASTTPAFQLLDIDAENIQRPGTLTDFKLSIVQATNNFTLIPQNYSIEISPYWVFFGNRISYNDFKKNKIKDNFLQTFNVSLATITTKDSSAGNDFRKVSFGIGFSLLRGNEINKEFEFKRKLALKEINKMYSEGMTKAISEDEEYKELESSFMDVLGTPDTSIFIDKLRKREKSITAAFGGEFLNSPDYKAQKEILENVKFERYGFKLDFAAGMALDFPTNDFNYSNVSSLGAWFTFGWDNPAKWSALFVSRLLAAPNIKDSLGSKKDLVNIDLGAKLVIDNLKKFSISGEVIYRAFIKKIYDEENKVRYTLNLCYELFPNQLITFNIGKEFDRKAETGGTLIAALNLVLGFGSIRPF